jgi:hypothetical protein
LEITTAQDVVVPGSEVVLWVGLAGVCVDSHTAQRELATDVYNWFSAFVLLSRNFWGLLCFWTLFIIRHYKEH